MGQATTEDDVKKAITINGISDEDKAKLTYDISRPLPDGNTAGNHNVTVTITYPDNSKSETIKQ